MPKQRYWEVECQKEIHCTGSGCGPQWIVQHLTTGEATSNYADVASCSNSVSQEMCKYFCSEKIINLLTWAQFLAPRAKTKSVTMTDNRWNSIVALEA